MAINHALQAVLNKLVWQILHMKDILVGQCSLGSTTFKEVLEFTSKILQKNLLLMIYKIKFSEMYVLYLILGMLANFYDWWASQCHIAISWLCGNTNQTKRNTQIQNKILIKAAKPVWHANFNVGDFNQASSLINNKT